MDLRCEECAKLRARISELEKKISELDAALAQIFEESSAAEAAAARRVEQANRQAERFRKEAQDAEYTQYVREDAINQLKRARERGDEHGERQALEKLERGW